MDINKYEKYLPIGTIVLLKNGTKRLMITGFCCFDTSNENKLYDYNGCLFPEGIIDSSRSLLFIHDQIDKIIHLGFIDDKEEIEFKKQLKNTLRQLKESI